MQVESVKLIDGQDGRDFVLYDESGNEIFSARLLHGSKELQVLWTNSLPWTPHRLLSIKRLLSGIGGL